MRKNIAICGGTHGNELTGVYFLKKWSTLKWPYSFSRPLFIEGNPKAIEINKRYVEKDLNRCFVKDDLVNEDSHYENSRAREIKQICEQNKIDVLIDLHTTTSDMGPSLIIMKGDKLALMAASYVQQKNSQVKIIMEEHKIEDNPYLINLAPTGIIIEIGPISQGILKYSISKLCESIIEDLLVFFNQKEVLSQKSKITVYKVVEKIDFPRNETGEITGHIHPDREKPFHKLTEGMPLFVDFNGNEILYKGQEVYPIFVNEAAYYEKGIAMISTIKIGC